MKILYDLEWPNLILNLLSESQLYFVSSTCRCQWVLPCRTNQDCVSEPRQQQKSELLAVSSSLDFYWFSICEVERVASPGPKETEDGGTQKEKDESGEGEGVSCELVIERLAVLKKKDLGAELRHFDYCESNESHHCCVYYESW